MSKIVPVQLSNLDRFTYTDVTSAPTPAVTTIVALILAADLAHRPNGCRAFYHAGPTLWNSLPDELRDSDSFDGFLTFLENDFFSRYYSVTSALEIYNELR